MVLISLENVADALSLDIGAEIKVHRGHNAALTEVCAKGFFPIHFGTHWTLLKRMSLPSHDQLSEDTISAASIARLLQYASA
jgi:hypothetical protein